MKKINEFRLVDGSYDLQEVKEIVLTLLDDKIKFHQLKAFSASERIGEEDSNSQVRLLDLGKSKKELIELFTSLKDDPELFNKKFKVYSEVKIELI